MTVLPGHAPASGAPNASGAPGVPPRPPQAPPVGGMVSHALGGVGGSGDVQAQGTVAMDAASAFNTIAHAVPASSDGVVKFVQPPTALSFEMSKKSLGLTIRYDGLVQVAPMGEQQSAVRIQLKPIKETLTPVYFVCAIASVLMMFIWWITMGLGLLGLLLGIIASGAQYHALATTTPRDMARKLMGTVPGNASPGAMPPTALPSASAMVVAPSPAPARAAAYADAPHAETPAVVAPLVDASGQAAPSTASSIYDQLAQLGKLRDAGVLTASEFDQQKAVLLARL